eukprot:g16238.t1
MPNFLSRLRKKSSIDVDGSEFSSLLPEVNDQFFGFADIERPIVSLHHVIKPSISLPYFVRYPSYYSSVISKLVDGGRSEFGNTVV